MLLAVSLLWLMSTGHVYPSWLQLIGCHVWSMEPQSSSVMLWPCSVTRVSSWRACTRLEAKHKPIISKSLELGIRRHSSLSLISCVALSKVSPHLSLAFRLFRCKMTMDFKIPRALFISDPLCFSDSHSQLWVERQCAQLQGKVSCTTGWRWARNTFLGLWLHLLHTSKLPEASEGDEKIAAWRNGWNGMNSSYDNNAWREMCFRRSLCLDFIVCSSRASSL